MAVIAVVLYHVWPKWFVSGFIGVDIFFVISGYLITSIIISQLEASKFSIFEFYSRRIRRIFPALLFVLFVTFLFGWTVLLHGEFKQIGKHVAAGGGFVSNLILWQESGYFDSSANTKPLLHLWSLGVEEQFYFIWPLLLWIIFKKRYNFLLLASIIFGLSMTANIVSIETNPSAAFFSPVMRFWELMSGGVAAYLQLHHRNWSPAEKKVASLAGAATLIAGFALIKPQYAFPGWWATLPVAGSFLLIMAGPMAIVNRQLLSLKAPVWVGLISYPLYLWHWPLLSFAYIIYGEKPSYQIKIALVLASFALAFLTFRLLEIPLRTRRNKVQLVGALAGGMAAMVAFGVLVSLGNVRERIDVHGAEIYLDALNDFDFPGQTFVPFRHQGIVFQKIPSRSAGLTVFIGDSLIQQYGPRIEQSISSNPLKFNNVIFATAGGCLPIQHVVRLPRFKFPLCPRSVEAAYDLANQAEVDIVVIGAGWYGYFSNNRNDFMFDNGPLHQNFPDVNAMENSYQSLQESIALLKKNGKRVYIILQPPTGDAFNPQNMYTGSRFESIKPLESINGIALDKFLETNATPRNRLIKIARDIGVNIIDPVNYLCKNNICPVLDMDGTPAYTDTVHMRPKFSRVAAAFLDETITPSIPTKASSITQPRKPSAPISSINVKL